jgi:hypothetical protein
MVRVRHDLDNNMPIFTALWEQYWPLEPTLSQCETESIENRLHLLDLHWNAGRTQEAIKLHSELKTAMDKIVQRKRLS